MTNFVTIIHRTSGLLNLYLTAGKFTVHSVSGSVNRISSYFTKGEPSSSPLTSKVNHTDSTQTDICDDRHIGLDSPSCEGSHLTESVSPNSRKARDGTVLLNSRHSDTQHVNSSPKKDITSYFAKSVAPRSPDYVASSSTQNQCENETQLPGSTTVNKQPNKRALNSSPSLDQFFGIAGEESTEHDAGPSVKKRRLSFDNGSLSAEEDLYQTCIECGEKIAVWDVQEHEDFHLALRLHNEEQKQTVPSRKSSKTSSICRNTILNYIKK